MIGVLESLNLGHHRDVVATALPRVVAINQLRVLLKAGGMGIADATVIEDHIMDAAEAQWADNTTADKLFALTPALTIEVSAMAH